MFFFPKVFCFFFLRVFLVCCDVSAGGFFLVKGFLLKAPCLFESPEKLVFAV